MTDMDRRRESDHWTFDKRVNLSLIAAILLNSGVCVWYFSSLDSRVSVTERTIEKLISQSTNTVSEAQLVKDRVLRLEMIISNIDAKLTDIKQLLEGKKR